MDYSLDYLSFLLKAITVVFAIALLSMIKQKNKDMPVNFEVLNKKRIKSNLAHLHNLSKDSSKDLQKELKKSLKKVNKINDNLFIIDFKGDIKATEATGLRTIVSTIIDIAKPGDRVLLKLESCGGEVTAYGLVASQIARFKNKNIHVTVAIDKVAASGGYLIAAVADSIIAAPFAVIGSIGVILQAPNINKLLKNNDIDIVELTAGKFKRTLTTVGENNKEGVAKAQEQIESIHESFKNHITAHRPDIAIDEVATGEIWLAKDAINHKLIDKIQTSDDFIANSYADFKVINVTQKTKKSKIQQLQNMCLWLEQHFSQNKIY